MAQQTKSDQNFTKLVDKYLDRVFRYLRNLTRNEDLAREFSHETFLRLHKQIVQSKEISEAYVFTTARNTALSHWRSEKYEEEKREAWGLETEPPSTTTPLDEKELGEALETSLGLLSENQRTVFLLSEIEGMKYETIAEVLDISMGTVASRKFNAVRVLRGELARLGYALP